MDTGFMKASMSTPLDCEW